MYVLRLFILKHGIVLHRLRIAGIFNHVSLNLVLASLNTSAGNQALFPLSTLLFNHLTSPAFQVEVFWVSELHAASIFRLFYLYYMNRNEDRSSMSP
jgi:hypothetical protein